VGAAPRPYGPPKLRQPSLAKAGTQVKILVPGSQPMVALLGQRDELLRLIESAFSSHILVRGNEITITGEEQEAERVAHLFEELLTILGQGQTLTTDSVGKTIDMIKEDDVRPSQVLGDVILTTRGRTLAPKTLGQKRYVDAIRRSTVTFSIGPAGTGKTYLAVATAVKALQGREVSRIILTRPAVEAGERLGFLPGTLYEKIDPYLKPLYDALYEMMDVEAFQRLLERGTIEVAPLAYMRGRTLNDSFIILDEAQNTTPEQMKMFLTRLGFGSKAVVNGDVTQIDLATGQRSGLVVVQEILERIEGIDFIHLGARDVVRHKIVQDIVEAYRAYGERSAKAE
jgi:phosphate starvation-inducible protein PhoH and related proteins